MSPTFPHQANCDFSLTEDPVEVTVVVPAFNEEEALGEDIEGIREALIRHGVPFEILVVDDGSTDTTRQVGLDHGARVISHYSNRGVGAARKTGIKAARGEIIVMIDADNSYPADQIPVLLGYMNRCDMVVGDRSIEAGTVPLLRKFAKRVIRWLASYLTRQKIYDLNSGLRAFRKETVLPYFNILPAGHSWVSTITIAYLASGLTVKYTPIDYYKRTGKSTFKPIGDTAGFIGLVFRTIMLFNPLRFFLPVVGFLFLLSVVKGVWIDKAWGPNPLSDSTVMIFMTAVILMALGIIAEIQVRLCRQW
ncbi:MAG: glycosyltransferase family 2 protein [Candidatus Omnitrophica bacterium]|nr:glycosyltransferase family 2 protein [Candidatus Omnitrophota bacterium]